MRVRACVCLYFDYCGLIEQVISHHFIVQTIKELIMATDMAQHDVIIEQFSSVADNFSFDDDQQMKLVSKAITHSYKRSCYKLYISSSLVS